MQASNSISAKEAAIKVSGVAVMQRMNQSEAKSASGVGVVLTDLNFDSIYANQAAVQIFSYICQSHLPANSVVFVQEQIRAIFKVERFTTQLQATGFLSGWRRYVCRLFLLESSDRPPIVVLLLERHARDVLQLAEVSRRFHLSRRECETVQHLIQGLTTKEVAERMRVSPNTIKQFVRLVMSKMGVTTRSGIVGRLIGE